jgi:hypothetical protein
MPPPESFMIHVYRAITLISCGTALACATAPRAAEVPCRDRPSPPGRAARELRLADIVDPSLAALERAALVFHLRSGADAEPDHALASALVVVFPPVADSAQRTRRNHAQGFADSTGYFVADSLPPGVVSVRAQGIGYIRQEFLVTVRAGYRDTLRLALAPALLCLAH